MISGKVISSSRRTRVKDLQEIQQNGRKHSTVKGDSQGPVEGVGKPKIRKEDYVKGKTGAIEEAVSNDNPRLWWMLPINFLVYISTAIS